MKLQSNDRIQTGMHSKELRQRVKSVLNDVLKHIDDTELQEEQIDRLKATNFDLSNQLAEANKRSADLQMELTNKNKQLDKFQSENAVLRKQVDGFDAFFEVFADKLSSVFNNFFTGSDGLLETDNAAIDEFIKNVAEYKQKIMDLESDYQQVVTNEPANSYEQVIQNTLPTVPINDKDLEREVETILQSNDVEELNLYTWKLKGFLHAEQVKRQLFEAITSHADTSTLTNIASYVVQFANNMINTSGEDTSHPGLEESHQSVCKIYDELKTEQALFKELESKIPPGEKKNALVMLYEQYCFAAKKLRNRAKNLREREHNTAMKLIYVSIGMYCSVHKTTDILKDLWHETITRYKTSGQHHKIVELCTEMIKKMPEMSSFYYHRACAYYELQKYGNAFVDINRALDLEPEHQAAQELKGEIESKLHK